MYFSSCFILLFVSSSYHIFFCRLLQSPFCSFCMFCSCIFFSWNYLDFFKFVLLFLLTTFLFFSLIQLFLNVNVIRFDPKLQIPICSCVFSLSVEGKVNGFGHNGNLVLKGAFIRANQSISICL